MYLASVWGLPAVRVIARKRAGFVTLVPHNHPCTDDGVSWSRKGRINHADGNAEGRAVLAPVYVTPVAISRPSTGMKMKAFFQWNSHARSIMMASKRPTGLPGCVAAHTGQQASSSCKRVIAIRQSTEGGRGSCSQLQEAHRLYRAKDSSHLLAPALHTQQLQHLPSVHYSACARGPSANLPCKRGIGCSNTSTLSPCKTGKRHPAFSRDSELGQAENQLRMGLSWRRYKCQKQCGRSPHCDDEG